jgi:predicted nuclease of predicted toxin-antitoxin system
MKLLIDVNLSPRWVEVLIEAGLEAHHWSALGPTNAPDSQIMAFAAEKDYVVLTNDLDFSAILAATHGKKPSVVQIRAGILSPRTIGAQVISALKQMTKELNDGALITIDTNRTRLSVLPLTLKKDNKNQ